MTRIAIDPITRVGGHLRIDVDAAGGEVTGAWSSGTMFRGMERILEGRDPRDAWMLAERICGTCTGVHALASVRAVEQAYGLTIPTNARLIRNLLAATLNVRDHVVQFYLAQAPDWVDAKAALRADPAATSTLARSLGPWPSSSPDDFSTARDRLAAVIDSDRPGLFGNGYWGHPAYRLSPEQSLMLMAHGLAALDWQRDLMRIHTLLGGKDPHPQSYLVGGMSLTPPWGGPPVRRPGEHPQLPGRNAPAALSAAGLALMDDLVKKAREFVAQVFVPDVLSLAKAYPEWGALGAGPRNYLAYGEFPEGGGADPKLYLPRGRILGGDYGSLKAVVQARIGETIAHAWYADSAGDDVHRPVDALATPAFSGATVPLTTLDGGAKYSWIKAPRYDGLPMEVGPLARMLVAYVDGQADVQGALEGAMTTAGLGPTALQSTLGRLVARAVESRVVANRAGGWLSELRANLASGDLAVADMSHWDPGARPDTADGWSLGEGPRGAVAHWITIASGTVKRYDVVDATTWNASPRDATGVPGPLEAALVGTPLADPSQPLEVLRTVHSFDPCAACAVHAVRPDDSGPIDVRVRIQGSLP